MPVTHARACKVWKVYASRCTEQACVVTLLHKPAESRHWNSTKLHAQMQHRNQAAQIRVFHVRSVHRRHAVCCRGMLQASCDMLGDKWLLLEQECRASHTHHHKAHAQLTCCSCDRMQEGAMKDTCKDTGAGRYSAEGETKKLAA